MFGNNICLLKRSGEEEDPVSIWQTANFLAFSAREIFNETR